MLIHLNFGLKYIIYFNGKYLFILIIFDVDKQQEIIKSKGVFDIYLTKQILASITTIICVICISCVDAMNLKLHLKVMGGLCAALVFTLYSIYWKLTAYINDEDNSIIEIPLIGSHISVHSIIENSLTITAIFFWKQTILSIYRKDKGVLIKSPSPKIEWIDNNDNNDNDRMDRAIYFIQQVIKQNQSKDSTNQISVDDMAAFLLRKQKYPMTVIVSAFQKESIQFSQSQFLNQS